MYFSSLSGVARRQVAAAVSADPVGWGGALSQSQDLTGLQWPIWKLGCGVRARMALFKASKSDCRVAALGLAFVTLRLHKDGQTGRIHHVCNR